MPSPQNGQTHSNNSLAIADKLFECVWLFCGVGAWSINSFQTNVHLQYHMKTSDSLWFSDIFRVHWRRTSSKNGLNARIFTLNKYMFKVVSPVSLLLILNMHLLYEFKRFYCWVWCSFACLKNLYRLPPPFKIWSPISLLILSKTKQMTELLFPLKSSEDL